MARLLWLQEQGLDIAPLTATAQVWEQEAKDHRLDGGRWRSIEAIFAIADALKPSSADAVAQLQRDGVGSNHADWR